ncbi:3-hydroxy-3-methylglutaryl-coenzyme A reductase 1 [Cajanus cajan]|uniref:3-hydroxy-3-methylglutaryl-coenzyme A reductase 1 n=1 Tax=Cajanus cajan TaxID=3821 RepID=UPI00098D7DA6|nr:3-hydroxy-3-methylglutaryl-coenzyme A reductase 1 [Cajanus cajan]
MDVRRRPLPSSGDRLKTQKLKNTESQSLFPLYLTNALFFTLFFSVAYFLLHRWRDKIRTSIPLHVVTPAEIAAIVSLIASAVYLLGFFGVASRASLDELSDDEIILKEDSRAPGPCPAALVESSPAKAKQFPLQSCVDSLNVTEKTKISLSHKTLDRVAEEKEVPLRHKTVDSLATKELSIPLPLKTADVAGPISLSHEDEETVQAVLSGSVPSYSLESRLGDCRRAAAIRHEAVQRLTGRSLEGLPVAGFDYESILGQCCEMPIGFVQIPVGVAGPLLLDGEEYTVPMATTEGCLVASTNRGCKAIHVSGGASSALLRDGMTRAPVVRFPSAQRAAQLKFFLEDPLNFDSLAVVFNKSSRFARLQSIQCAIAGKNLYMRFRCSTGDAMGMNMVSKGVQNVLDFLQSDFPDMDVIGISGNFCSDKKAAAVNWIEGRGKSVVCEAVIKEDVVKKVLKTSVEALVELNMLKNLTGSAIAGALGGFNAHASNIVSAIYIATGQDPAQNVESSHCITMMEAVNDGKDLHISVTMPSVEVGTVGGGTQLASQSACLNLLGVKGANKESPGANSRLLATIIAGSVLAGELSLMSAIAAGQLVKSHMKYNRSSRDISKVAS